MSAKRMLGSGEWMNAFRQELQRETGGGKRELRQIGEEDERVEKG